MSPRTLAVALLCLAALAPPSAAAPPADGGPRVVAAYPNPVADGDAGEFVVVSGDGRPLELTDGEASVRLNGTDGRVAVSPDPAAARNLTDLPVAAAPGLRLSNAGERFRLRRGNRTLDAVAYADAPEGERGDRRRDGWRWRPLGLSPRPVRTFGSANVTAFVLPDAPSVPIDALRSAEDRILLAGYTFASHRIADALVAAADRGVTVRVLVDDAPVGGRAARAAAALDRLDAAGVRVSVVGGPRARFDYHHPKYAVVDDAALVLTENWKPAGTGGRSSRGWGVRVDSPAVAADLASLFRHDADGRDVTPWAAHRAGRRFDPQTAANGSYPSRIAPERVRVERVRVFTAPGNAGAATASVVEHARERVDVIQPTVGGRDTALLRATVRAAERGVRVRILLSGAWYVADENRRLVERLDDLAERRDLPLEARVAEPNGRFEKIHAKGVVVDDTVLVGSLNWNQNAIRENREVVVALDGAEVADYYRRVFEADWRGGDRGPSVPAGFLLAVALAVGVAVAVVRRRC